MYFKIAAELGKLAKIFEDKKWAKVIAGPKVPVPGHTLYHMQLSPYAMRVRKFIFKHKLDIPFRDILLDDEACKELTSQGGKDQVPCLKIISPEGDAKWIYESKDIVKYLEKLV